MSISRVTIWKWIHRRGDSRGEKLTCLTYESCDMSQLPCGFTYSQFPRYRNTEVNLTGRERKLTQSPAREWRLHHQPHNRCWITFFTFSSSRFRKRTAEMVTEMQPKERILAEDDERVTWRRVKGWKRARHPFASKWRNVRESRWKMSPSPTQKKLGEKIYDIVGVEIRNTIKNYYRRPKIGMGHEDAVDSKGQRVKLARRRQREENEFFRRNYVFTKGCEGGAGG